MIKESDNQEDVVIINIYATNKSFKIQETKLKGKVNSTTIHGDFDSHFLATDITRQKVKT